jgi:hypothetical protein
MTTGIWPRTERAGPARYVFSVVDPMITSSPVGTVDTSPARECWDCGMVRPSAVGTEEIFAFLPCLRHSFILRPIPSTHVLGYCLNVPTGQYVSGVVGLTYRLLATDVMGVGSVSAEKTPHPSPLPLERVGLDSDSHFHVRPVRHSMPGSPETLARPLCD